MRVRLPVLLALLSGAAATSAAVAGPQAPPARVGGQIKEPRKLKNVPPRYPEEAKQAGVQGVVILECTISPEGRVAQVKVLRGVPLLDEAAIEAVRQWIYTPTLLDGKPVPVIMTVTVNFRLSRPPGNNAPASGPVARSEEREAELRRLLRAMGADFMEGREVDVFIEVQRKLRPEVPGEVWKALRAEFPAGELEGAVLRVLDASLGPDDVRAATFFYESDAGRRLLGAQSELAQEVTAIGMRWMTRVLEGLPERLKKAGVKTTD